MSSKTAVIAGAGPAGLTAAYELLDKTDIKPVVYELSPHIGGISKTVVYKGNRIDIGGHRFFSKSNRVTDWWLNILPLQGAPSRDDLILGRKIETSGASTRRELGSRIVTTFPSPDPEKEDEVMLVRSRISRIFHLKKLFDYPIRLDAKLVANLGLSRMAKIGGSFLWAKAFPNKTENSLEDFLINRFGGELYRTFFRDYTEKVWGITCRDIKPDWGAQRIKDLSVAGALFHALRSLVVSAAAIDQRRVQTSLIERFLYPKLGPGQMWEEVAAKVIAGGGKIFSGHRVVGLKADNGRIVEARVLDLATGKLHTQSAEFFFSTMPVKELVEGLEPSPPQSVTEVASGLHYRDFLTVGLLLKKLKMTNDSGTQTVNNSIPDNWIYIQEPSVKLARIQIFNNWSPYLVTDPNLIWIGLEYFADEGDEVWEKSEGAMIDFAVHELVSLGVIDRADVLDATVLKMPKAYPTYAGSYDRFQVVKDYLNSFENLFLIGRNGMHKYNNTDHSMLTAMLSVENIVKGITDKEHIWQVNTEECYHEET